jgi:glycosyltransferase involved in cell wall biosynthesis
MVVVAQMGARMHYAVPAILARVGILERLYTDLYAPPLPERVQRSICRFGPAPLKRWFGRVSADIPTEKIVSFGTLGLEYYGRRMFAGPAKASATYLWAGKELCRRVIHCGLGEAKSVFTYNSAGLELMRHASRRQMRAIMEQTIAPVEIEDALLEAERSTYPHWEHSVGKDPHRSALAHRERMEWQEADVIICGSEFVRDGIRGLGGPVERCRVVPYGVRLPLSTVPREGPHKPLRILTVGAVGLRKGAPYVLAAARDLGDKAEFRMAGQVEVTLYAQKLLSERVTVLRAVPRSEIHRQFAWADVFLLPTLCEGSATACYEALSYGLPVITTPNAGSIVRDGLDGFIVPIRDAGATADRIERLADGDLWIEMSANARCRAADYTLEKYGQRLLSVLRENGES